MDAPADSKTAEKLVPQTLALSDSRETTVLDLLGEELEGVFGELETLLHEGSKLTDTATLLAQNLLGVGGTDDNLRDHVKHGNRWKISRMLTSVRA